MNLALCLNLLLLEGIGILDPFFNIILNDFKALGIVKASIILNRQHEMHHIPNGEMSVFTHEGFGMFLRITTLLESLDPEPHILV